MRICASCVSDFGSSFDWVVIKIDGRQKLFYGMFWKDRFK